MYSTSNLIQQGKTIIYPSISTLNSINIEELHEKQLHSFGS